MLRNLRPFIEKGVPQGCGRKLRSALEQMQVSGVISVKLSRIEGERSDRLFAVHQRKYRGGPVFNPVGPKQQIQVKRRIGIAHRPAVQRYPAGNSLPYSEDSPAHN